MKNILIIVIALLIAGCDKDPCKGLDCLNGGTCDNGKCLCPEGYEGENCETKKEPTQEQNFDETKGWTLLQAVRYDGTMFDIYGRSTLGYYGLDYKNNNLRLFYYKGLQSQQDFLYSASRVDEFAADKSLINRDSIGWVSPFQQDPATYQYYSLRNGKPSILKWGDGSANGVHWQVYENGILEAQTNQLWGEQIGFVTSNTDESIFTCGLYNRSDAVLAHFYVHHYNNTAWRSYPYGSINNNKSIIIGADLINSVMYAFLASHTGTDSTTITAFRFDEVQNNWIKDFEQVFPGRNLGFNVGGRDYGEDRYFFSNNGSPVILLKTENTFFAYKVNIAAKSIVKEGTASIPASSGSVPTYGGIVCHQGEIYIGYNTIDGGTLSAPSVVKLSGNSFVNVGLPGLTKKSSGISLAVRNNKVHAITYSYALDKYGEIYIAVPQ